jgi:wyosine [tRNA(Phe)-imidazoG37] synthetase (radical SAM superfamily)
MQYVFGPVPSRRLGQSLGIDPIPLKTCNRNCVYCQLGRTTSLTNTRREYCPGQEILLQVASVLERHAPGEIDWITFVGSGEPTLHSGLGWMIREVKSLTTIPVAVITNGALLYCPDVRSELALADAVMPTLDAGSPDLYQAINRPHPETTFKRILEGLTAFREEYKGRLWVEVMLVRGMNDSTSALRDIAAVLGKIHPDGVHIDLPSRPPAEPWVKPPNDKGIARAVEILGQKALVVSPSEGEFDLSGYDDIGDAVFGIISRHPMRETELRRALECWTPGQVDVALAQLAAGGRVRTVKRNGVRFWASVETRFPD